MRPEAGWFISLNFSFLICKMGMIKDPCPGLSEGLEEWGHGKSLERWRPRSRCSVNVSFTLDSKNQKALWIVLRNKSWFTVTTKQSAHLKWWDKFQETTVDSVSWGFSSYTVSQTFFQMSGLPLGTQRSTTSGPYWSRLWVTSASLQRANWRDCLKFNS